ncbi:hypothetical protein JOF56_003508 [Kibdelosporangium banguiense]|uniref:Integral membrane protein n=1 Tax=Kibdelosporangium banguiense TaxID=1365924 RepID=A0ABS4TGZ5_9PSEU|nr:hypothetical protein [Kibdelosporangium banguiense]MBP2323123.1 hypothetical protein [Kibdelosporangium banguiense]
MSVADTAVAVKKPRVTLWVLRVLVTGVAAMMAAQPILAGMYLSGDFDALDVHGEIGTAWLGGGSIFQLVAAIVYTWAGRGSFLPPVVGVAVLALVVVQSDLGTNRMVGWHIPVGVSLVLTQILFAIWVYKSAAGRARR